MSQFRLNPDSYEATSFLKALLRCNGPVPVRILHAYLCDKYDPSVLKVLGADPYSMARFLKSIPDIFTVWMDEKGECFVQLTEVDYDLSDEDDDGEEDDGVSQLERVPLYDQADQDLVARAVCFLKQVLELRGPCVSNVLHGSLACEFGKAATDLMGIQPCGLAEFLLQMPEDFTVKLQTGGNSIISLASEVSIQKNLRLENGSNSEHEDFDECLSGNVRPDHFPSSRRCPRNDKCCPVSKQAALNFIVQKVKMTGRLWRCKDLLNAIRREAPKLLQVTGDTKKSMARFVRYFRGMFHFDEKGFVHLNETSQEYEKTATTFWKQEVSPLKYEDVEQHPDQAQVSMDSDGSDHYTRGSSLPFMQESTENSNCILGTSWIPHTINRTVSPEDIKPGLVQPQVLPSSDRSVQDTITGRGRILATNPRLGILEATDGTVITFGPHCGFLGGEPICHSYFRKDAEVNFEAVVGKMTSTATKIWQ